MIRNRDPVLLILRMSNRRAQPHEMKVVGALRVNC